MRGNAGKNRSEKEEEGGKDRKPKNGMIKDRSSTDHTQEPKRVTFRELNDNGIRESEDISNAKYNYDETAPLTPNANEILKRGSLLTSNDRKKNLYIELPSKQEKKQSKDSVSSNQERRRHSSLVLDPHLEMEETDPLKTYIKQNVSNFRKSMDSEKNSSVDDSLNELRERFRASIQNNRNQSRTNESPSKQKNIISVYAVNEDKSSHKKGMERYGYPETNTDYKIGNDFLPSPQRKHYKMCIKPTFKKTENEEEIKTKLGNNNLKIKIRGNISFDINE